MNLTHPTSHLGCSSVFLTIRIMLGPLSFPGKLISEPAKMGLMVAARKKILKQSPAAPAKVATKGAAGHSEARGYRTPAPLNVRVGSSLKGEQAKVRESLRQVRRMVQARGRDPCR